MVGNNVDVLSIAETKLDSSFPNAQFLLPAFQEPLRLDINHQSSGLLVYIKASLPSKILSKFKLPIDIQIIPFEINLRKEKWLFVSIYKPLSQSNQYFLDLLGDLLDFYSQDYDNKVILGDFNLETSNPSIVSFMNNQNLFNLVKSNTCFKGEGSCIDLILTNRKYSFKNTCSSETGLSDHHHLIYFVMKTTFKSEEPKKLIYRDYSNFSSECFKDDFMSSICQEKHDFIDTLNKHAPKKIKTFRGNQKRHINKTLRKAIMKRSQLKNKASKTRNATDILNYKKQRNYVLKLNNQCKKDHFDRLNPVKDSKPFWKSCEPYFSNEHSFGDSKIALSENGEFLTENNKIAKTFNSFFETVTDSLNLFSWPSKVNVCDDKVQGIIHNFSNHPSILKIKEKVQLHKRFSFLHVSEATVRKVVKNVPSDKVSAGEIPIKILKESIFCFPDLTNCINESLTNNKFPDTLKLSDITPVFEKLDPSDKADYRPVSILPLVSKVFEKIMYDQLYKYIVHFLNQLLCGLRKAYSTHHALFRLLQKWQKELDSGGFIGTILMDLSKVGSAYSKWSNIKRGIPQGSILGPLLFNIFINDIFMIIEQSDICNFADDNTLYSRGKSLTDIKENLVSDTKSILNWFKLNSLKANPGKFQFMILGDRSHHKHELKIN